MVTIERFINNKNQQTIMAEEITDMLVKAGLTKNESKVYLALLDSGLTTAGEIIKKTNIHRNLVYDALYKLIKKGIVSYVIIKNIKHFEASNVNRLKEYIEKKKQEIIKKEKIISTILPKLEKIKKETTETTKVSVYEGKKALKNLLDDVALSKKEVLIFATGRKMKSTMGPYFYKWHNKLKENNIKSRIVIPSGLKKEEYNYYKKYYKIRELPKEYSQPATFLVYDDKILHIIWSDNPITILIKDQKLAKTYRDYFEILWSIGKKIKD